MNAPSTTDSRAMSSIEWARITHRPEGARIVRLTAPVCFQPSGIGPGGHEKTSPFRPDFHTVPAGARVLMIPSKGGSGPLAYACVNDFEMFGGLQSSEYEELPAAEQQGRVSQVAAGRLVLVEGTWQSDDR